MRLPVCALLTAMAVLAAQPSTFATESYEAALERALDKYASPFKIPTKTLDWIAKTYGKPLHQVGADLIRVPQERRYRKAVLFTIQKYGGASKVPKPSIQWLARAHEKDVKVVATDLLAASPGEYPIVLQRVLAKYGAWNRVPRKSATWLSKVYRKPLRAITFDLQRLSLGRPVEVATGTARAAPVVRAPRVAAPGPARRPPEPAAVPGVAETPRPAARPPEPPSEAQIAALPEDRPRAVSPPPPGGRPGPMLRRQPPPREAAAAGSEAPGAFAFSPAQRMAVLRMKLEWRKMQARKTPSRDTE